MTRAGEPGAHVRADNRRIGACLPGRQRAVASSTAFVNCDLAFFGTERGGRQRSRRPNAADDGSPALAYPLKVRLVSTSGPKRHGASITEWARAVTRWPGILALTGATGCSGASEALPAGPGRGAQSATAQCAVTGEPCCSAASCDARPGCVGVPCNVDTTDATPDVTASFDGVGGAVADATLAAPAPQGGGDSVADGTIDNATVGEPSSDDTSDLGVDVAADGAPGNAPDSGSPKGDDAADTGSPNDGDAAVQGTSVDMGLVALYHFDETSGTTSADSSGNGNTATLQGGVTFSPGVRGNAATFSGVNQYVTLPIGIVSGLTNFSISAWLYQSLAGHGHRVFDFGTGTTVNMFLTPDGDVLRYAVTTGGHDAEEDLLTAGTLPIGIWQHLTVTQAAANATLYLDGIVIAQNGATTLHPSSLGVTTQNWIGRSQYADNPYLAGKVDEFRIYNRALGAAEVMDLYLQER